MSLQRFWSSRNIVSILLWPVSVLFCVVSRLRRWLFREGILSSWQAPKPVVVVGNISVGGTGKTPLTLALIKLLASENISVGVVSRGYKADRPKSPLLVDSNSTTASVGDEPLLIAQLGGVPVCVFPQRRLAVETLLSHHDVDLVLCDDGLQHYALTRDIEIAVIDGVRLHGNGFLLPAGPLRESVQRLRGVDFVLYNGQPDDASTPGQNENAHVFDLCIDEFESLDRQTRRSLDSFQGQPSHALAGIGNPQRFFNALNEAGLEIQTHPLQDHHDFSLAELQALQDKPLLITEKDAVKCRELMDRHTVDLAHCWVARTSLLLPAAFESAFLERVRPLLNQ